MTLTRILRRKLQKSAKYKVVHSLNETDTVTWFITPFPSRSRPQGHRWWRALPSLCWRCKCGARRTQSRARLSYAEPKPTFAVASQMRRQSYKEKRRDAKKKPKTAIFDGYFSPDFFRKIRGCPFKIWIMHYELFKNLSDWAIWHKQTGQLDMDILAFLNVQTYMSI